MIDNNNFKIAIAPECVKQVGLVGAGIIGSTWAAHFLARGLDVIVTDPDPEAEKKLRAIVDIAWHSLEELGLAENASRDRLSFTTSIDDALKDADFIQESTPECEDIKDQVMTAISEVARPDVIIASSSSGILPTRLQAQCKNPERMIVGHPFNPVHLIPLVEVVGGKQTAPEIIRWAMAFYKYWGKEPLHCRTEKPKHIGNRLQAALFSEMLHLVAEKAASTAELDAALSSGPGMRWALMGSNLIYHLGCGDVGIGKGIEGYHLPPLRSEIAAPVVDRSLVEQLVDGTTSQTAGRSIKEMEQIRDEFLVGLLKLRANIEAKYGFNQSRFL